MSRLTKRSLCIFLNLTFFSLLCAKAYSSPWVPSDFRPENTSSEVLSDDDHAYREKSFLIDVGAESFFLYDHRSNEILGGLAAIMVDLDAQISKRFSFFGAFHFDTSPWHALLNQPFKERKDAFFEYDIGLEVEEFFLTWQLRPDHLEFFVGRRFSLLSYANQLHLADFQFNAKPRLFTEYWGNNHGLAMDGIGLRWFGKTDRLSGSVTLEASKNGYLSEHTTATAVFDAHYAISSLETGLRGFAYFDYETENHPLFHYVQDQTNLLLANDKIDMNAIGGGLYAFWPLSNDRGLFFQSEIVNRKMAGQNYLGTYSFLTFNYSETLAINMMYQQLDIPVIKDGTTDKTNENAISLGISYYPVQNHRIRLEYSDFNNSDFYRSMLLAKWTFCVSIMD